MNKVVIFGTAEAALMAHFYLTHDSPYEVAAFTVEQAFMKEDTLCGLEVVPFERIEHRYPPDQCKMLVSVAYGRMGERAEKYQAAKARHYELASYISSRAVVWPGMVAGDNCVVLECSVIEPFASIGNDVFIAPGALVAHHSTVQDHCVVEANAVVLGGARVEAGCFLGANSTIRDGVTIARECIIGAGVTMTRHTKAGEVYAGGRPELLPMTSDAFSPRLTRPVH